MVYNSRNLEALFDLVRQQTHTSIHAGRTLTSISPEALTFLLISAPLKNMSDFSYMLTCQWKLGMFNGVQDDLRYLEIFTQI